MKKKILIALTVTVAALAAAFGLAGCFGGEGGTGTTTPATKREYAVFDDGFGKKYRLDDGEQITVYYKYDAEKVLDFSLTYYNVDTNEETCTGDKNDMLKLPCNKPTVYTYIASPLNDDGTERGDCYLTVIVSAQYITDQLEENVRPVRANVSQNVGAVYTFIPEMTGCYTVSCVSDDESDEVNFTVTDNTGKALTEGDIFNEGWRYYIHVSAKVDNEYTFTGVDTSVTFTPPVVEEGENDVILGSHSTFAFTPEESGAYSVWDDAFGSNTSYEILYFDGETEDYRHVSEQRGDVFLSAGTEYYLQSIVGYEAESNAKLNVKRVDRELAADTDNELKWNEMYVFTADKTSNYKFTVDRNGLSSEAKFTVYDWNGKAEYGKTFTGDGEFEFVLGAGKHVISMYEDCTATVSCSPQKLGIGVSEGVRAINGEVLLFTPPISGVYNFSSFGQDGAVFAVTDKDGNTMDGERLTAGEEYMIAVTFDEEGYSKIGVEAEPIADGTILLNRAFEAAAGNVYSLSCTLDGVYRFTGASLIAVYDADCEAVETDGDTVYLKGGSDYYAVISADEPAGGEQSAEVKVIFYPNALPADEKAGIIGTGYYRLELTKECTVSVILTHLNAATFKFLDSDLRELRVYELKAGDSPSRLSYTYESAGIYYVYAEHAGTLPTIGFAARPEGVGGEFAAERGVRYTSSSALTCTFTGVNEDREITVTVNREIGAQNIFESVKAYCEPAGTGQTYLTLKRLSGDLQKTTFTFTAPKGVEKFFIEFAPGLEFVIE